MTAFFWGLILGTVVMLILLAIDASCRRSR